MFEVLINFFIENPGVILVGGMAFLVMMVGRQWVDEKPKIPKTPWPPLFLIIILISMMYFLGSSIGNSHNNYEQEAYKLIKPAIDCKLDKFTLLNLLDKQIYWGKKKHE